MCVCVCVCVCLRVTYLNQISYRPVTINPDHPYTNPQPHPHSPSLGGPALVFQSLQVSAHAHEILPRADRVCI